MEIIEAPELDLISPFPESQLHRVWGWSRAFSNLNIPDDGPRTKEAFEAYMKGQLTAALTFGIIDRDGLLGLPNVAPLVGIIVFEPVNTYNGYIHIATSRPTWGTRMADQALQTAINYIFTHNPNIQKVSAAIADEYVPAKALARRLGAKLEGILEGIAVRDGELMNVAHYGILYSNWKYKPTHVVLRSKV